MKNYDTAAAVACLGEAFLDILKDGPKALSGLEREVLRLGHMTIASAVALALEARLRLHRFLQGRSLAAWEQLGECLAGPVAFLELALVRDVERSAVGSLAIRTPYAAVG